MADNALKIKYKLYLEAEDVSQSRILSSASYLENVLHNHANPYIKCAQIDNESDLDEFVVRYMWMRRSRRQTVQMRMQQRHF